VNSLPDDATVYMTKDILAWLREPTVSPSYHLANPSYINYNTVHHFVAQSDDEQMKAFEAAGYESLPSPTHTPGKLFQVGAKPVNGMPVVHVFPSEEVTQEVPVSSAAEYLVFSSDKSEGGRSIAAFAEEVRKYNSTLKPDENGIELDLNSIETRKNLEIIERLSDILTVALSLLAVLFVMNQTMSMLMMHLERNKRNLGTLKAFGTPNQAILSIYGGISLVIMSSTFLVAWLLNLVVGTPLLLAIARLSGLNATAGDLSFKQWNVGVLALIFVGLPMVRVVLALRKRLSQATPGDLIYDRSHE
jgi:hypothetical protein